MGDTNIEAVAVTASCEQISGLAFELSSIGSTLRAALAMLSASERYGMADDGDGILMCDVGQILIDTRTRVERISNALGGVEMALYGLRARGAVAACMSSAGSKTQDAARSVEGPDGANGRNRVAVESRGEKGGQSGRGVQVPADAFDIATLQMEQISAMMLALGIQTTEVEGGSGVSNEVLGTALSGYGEFLAEVRARLCHSVLAEVCHE